MKKFFSTRLSLLCMLMIFLSTSSLSSQEQSPQPHQVVQKQLVTETVIAQNDSTTFLDRVETNSVQSIDGFLEKYEPKVSNKLGKLWEFTKSTTTSLYKAFVRYLIVKDSFPIVIGLLLIWLAWILSGKLKVLASKTSVLFEKVTPISTFTEYENVMVEKNNQRNAICDMLIKALADNIFYVALLYILWKLVPYFYNLTLLLVAPEARVLMEVTNLYKSF